MSSRYAKEFHRLKHNLEKKTNGQAFIRDWDPDNITTFIVEVTPQGGPYKQGKFLFQIIVPDLYPDVHPDVVCLTDIYHPNIDPDITDEHNICLNLFDEWNKSFGLEDCVQGLIFLLYNPNLSDPISAFFDGSNESQESFASKVQASLRGESFDGITFIKNPGFGEPDIAAKAGVTLPQEAAANSDGTTEPQSIDEKGAVGPSEPSSERREEKCVKEDVLNNGEAIKVEERVLGNADDSTTKSMEVTGDVGSVEVDVNHIESECSTEVAELKENAVKTDVNENHTEPETEERNGEAGDLKEAREVNEDFPIDDVFHEKKENPTENGEKEEKHDNVEEEVKDPEPEPPPAVKVRRESEEDEVEDPEHEPTAVQSFECEAEEREKEEDVVEPSTHDEDAQNRSSIEVAGDIEDLLEVLSTVVIVKSSENNCDSYGVHLIEKGEKPTGSDAEDEDEDNDDDESEADGDEDDVDDVAESDHQPYEEMSEDGELNEERPYMDALGCRFLYQSDSSTEDEDEDDFSYADNDDDSAVWLHDEVMELNNSRVIIHPRDPSRNLFEIILEQRDSPGGLFPRFLRRTLRQVTGLALPFERAIRQANAGFWEVCALWACSLWLSGRFPPSRVTRISRTTTMR